MRCSGCGLLKKAKEFPRYGSKEICCSCLRRRHREVRVPYATRQATTVVAAHLALLVAVRERAEMDGKNAVREFEVNWLQHEPTASLLYSLYHHQRSSLEKATRPSFH
jgi:hypothetical protein